MINTKMHTQQLLDILRTNRERHKQAYDEAIEGFAKAYTLALEQMGEKAAAGDGFDMHVALTKPTEHLRDYDRMIGMLDHTTEDIIELSEQEYDQYVLDEWGWKQQFTTSNALYNIR